MLLVIEPVLKHSVFSAQSVRVFLQIVSQCCHEHMLVGLWHSSAVDPLHIVVVDECSQNGFYCTAAAFGEETGVVFVPVQLFMHLVVQRFVDAFL